MRLTFTLVVARSVSSRSDTYILPFGLFRGLIIEHIIEQSYALCSIIC